MSAKQYPKSMNTYEHDTPEEAVQATGDELESLGVRIDRDSDSGHAAFPVASYVDWYMSGDGIEPVLKFAVLAGSDAYDRREAADYLRAVADALLR